MGKKEKSKQFQRADLDYALGLGLSEDEWERMVEGMGREPSLFECRIFAELWSDSYCFKSTLSLFGRIQSAEETGFSLQGAHVGFVEIDEKRTLALVADQANTDVRKSPYFGASVGLGGVVDALLASRAKPIALFNLLRVGDPEQSLEHKRLTSAVSGLRDTSNRLGVPILGGEVYFHPSYNESMVVNGFALGLVEKSENSTVPQPKPGYLLVYFGRDTGPDGLYFLGGESVYRDASKGEDYRLKSSDSFFQAKLWEPIRAATENGSLSNMVCLGTGGLVVGSAEIARRVGTGG